MNHTFKWLIIKRIDRKITTREILLDITPNVITQDHTILIGGTTAGGRATKGSDLNQLTAWIHVRQLKAATDNTAALAKDVFNLMRLGVSDSIKVFWTQTQ